MAPKWLPNGSREASRKGAGTGGRVFAKTLLACTREQSFRNLAIMEQEARETEERQALQARREQREQEEQQERERQNHIEEQGESGESRARIETASPYDRICPSSPAARARRAV